MSTLEFVKSLERWNQWNRAQIHKSSHFSDNIIQIKLIEIYFYPSVREQLKELTKQFDKSENDLKALQSVGQIVGEVLKQLTEDKCKWMNCFEWNVFF